MSDMSVRAILSAVDRGFSSTMKQAMGVAGKLEKRTSSFMTGILQGAGQQAFYMLAGGCRELVSEIDASNVAWKTFEGNMKILGKNDKQINTVRKSMQKYAEQTIYSSSDMASTYSQLAAVGVKSADKLVTGFGGLAAAAENPQQAMKTLSQQATQMAGRPNVAWQDFKLMLEQTPAGIAAVAKEMGMTTSELVSKIQAGEVKTEDFFKAIEQVGNSKGFTKLATSYKSAGQAMDGLKETIGNKLTPAYDALSQKAIGGIEGIIDKVSELDGEEIKDKVLAGIDAAMPYWEQFKNVLGVTGKALKTVGKFFLEHSNILSKGIPIVLGLVAAYKGFQVVNTIVGGVKSFVGSITSLAGGTGSKIAENLNKTATAQQNVGKVSQASSTQMMASAKAFMMMGAGVLLIAAGFGILAYSAIQLANAGPMAIAVMAGMVVALVGVSFAMAGVLKFLAPMSAQLMPAAMAMLAMGAAVLLVAAGFALMAYAAIQLANSGGLAIGAMAGMVLALAGLMALAAVLGPVLTAGAVGMLAFGAAILMVGAGVLLASVGLAMMAGSLPMIAATAGMAAIGILKLAASSMALLGASAAFVAASGSLIALGGAGAIAGAALLIVAKSSTKIAEKSAAAAAGLKGVAVSLNTLKVGAAAQAAAAMTAVTTSLKRGATTAKTLGSNLSKGFAAGMRTCLSEIRSAANEMVKAANKAIQAKAKIKSPSRVTKALGAYYGEGYELGILGMVRDAKRAAEKLVSVPTASVPALAMAYSGGLSSEYDYYRQNDYTIEVPLTVDGREFARATAKYSQEELNTRTKRENRKMGIL